MLQTVAEQKSSGKAFTTLVVLLLLRRQMVSLTCFASIRQAVSAPTDRTEQTWIQDMPLESLLLYQLFAICKLILLMFVTANLCCSAVLLTFPIPGVFWRR